MNQEETQAKPIDIFPPDDNEEEGSGPGCLVWGVMGLFGLVLAIAIVFAAALAGLNQGIATGETTAIARTQQYVLAECSQLPTDIAMNRIQIVQQRYDKWQGTGEIPACAQAYIPQATLIYQQSLITDTPMPTALSTATATPIPQDTAMPTVETVQNDSGYNLGALLLEAQGYLDANNYQEAIRTLDAIMAIDPNFESNTINTLLFNALRQRATTLYRSEEGSLAEAIALTNRAELYGDVGELNFERTVAQYYLDAQAHIDVNYSQAIVFLSQVINFAPTYPRGTGLARQQLISQYIGYGDALALGAEPCAAVQQYDLALQLSSTINGLQVKRDEAQTQCTFGSSSTSEANTTLTPAPVGVGN
jgi:tetratricopeptide (TPR) repeat protein